MPEEANVAKAEEMVGKEKMLYNPETKRVELARWIGRHLHYSMWEFYSTGTVVLGEPYIID